MIVPGISFPGNCAEAHELYKKAFGMVVNSVTYNDYAPSDYHDEPLTEETKKQVLHSECSIYGVRVNMGDIGGVPASGNFNVFLSSEDEVRKVFNILKEGGTVEDEPQPVFWSSLYCSLIDRFGISWQIMVE